MDSLGTQSDDGALAIVKQIQSSIGSRTMSRRALNSLAVNVLMIGADVRIGYLPEVFINDPVRRYGDMVKTLRESCSLCHNLTHVYEPTSDQSFIVNLPLLRNRLGFVEDGQATVEAITQNLIPASFVSLNSGSYCEQRLSLPPRLAEALIHLLKASSPGPLSITLPSGLTPLTTVPLAAVLLEYSVGYVPEPGSSPPYLSGVTLTVYECLIKFGKLSRLHGVAGLEHSLLKFSIPKPIVQANSYLDTSCIVKDLREKFTDRVERAFCDAIFIVSVDENVVLTQGVAI